MSLCKKACKNCWLPPDEASDLCRKCRGPSSISDITRVRFRNHKKEDCVFFREKLQHIKYTGNYFPEQCLLCTHYILTRSIVDISRKKALYNGYIINSCDNLIERFRGFLKANHELTLESITELLTFSQDDDVTSKKIITALVAASGKRKWILQELILRSLNVGSLLSSPIILPNLFSESLWGYLETFEEWWPFWEDVAVAAKRKIKFRTLTWKEELIAVTWHPDRFIPWCLDTEEYHDLTDNWSRTF